jgi:hypothetical protein
LLAYPDFFKVGVSAEGNHDQRGYLAPWHLLSAQMHERRGRKSVGWRAEGAGGT